MTSTLNRIDRPAPADRAKPRGVNSTLAQLRVGVITTSRADYGIYCPLLEALRDAGTRIEIFAGGTHPVAHFGTTIEQIRADDWGATHVVSHHVEGDRDVDLVRNGAAALTAFGDSLAAHRPDLVLALGDRYEMFAATSAAALLKIPIAHLHGGDLTEGAYDDQFRHAMTKLAHLHFAALPIHAVRILAMGEEPWRVHAVGALAIDALRRFRPESAAEIHRDVGFSADRHTLLLAFHPETLSTLPPADAFSRIARAVESFDGNVLLIGSNADEGHLDLNRAAADWSRDRSRTARVASLSQQRFWSWLHYAALLVGNSSSGVIEAPSLSLPVVNIGDRQSGRLRAGNVIDVTCDTAAIAAAIRRATAPAFRNELKGLVNPYGDGRAAEQILNVLAALPPRDLLLRKRWTDASAPASP